jgi:hypothetical protein
VDGWHNAGVDGRRLSVDSGWQKTSGGANFDAAPLHLAGNFHVSRMKQDF